MLAIARAGVLLCVAVAAQGGGVGDGDHMNLLQINAALMEEEEELAVAALSAVDAPLCTQAEMDVFLHQMGNTCRERVIDARTSGQPLSEKERCFCYLSVDAVKVASFKCRTMAAKETTMAEEYSLCSAGATQFAQSNPEMCDLNELLPTIGKMGALCKADVNLAIWNDVPLSDKRRCHCYNQLDAVSAHSLTCKIMASKALTFSEEYDECKGSLVVDDGALPTCTQLEIGVALKQMGGTCRERVNNAIDENTPLSDKERCFCYLSVDADTASSLQCLTAGSKINTMAQEYVACAAGARDFVKTNPGMCDLNVLLPTVSKMGDQCKADLNRAIWHDTPLEEQRRCHCYNQLDAASAQSLTCRIMASKTKTMAEEYDECKARSASSASADQKGSADLEEAVPKSLPRFGKKVTEARSARAGSAEEQGSADAEEVVPKSLSSFGKRAHNLERAKHRTAAKAKSKSTGQVRLLDFTQAEIVFNNLGGQGPQKLRPNGEPAPNEIRYRNLVKGSDIDLVITAAKGYKAYNPSRNGVLGGNAQINAKSGTSASLTFTFVEQGTYIAHTMPRFYITFSDLDERHGGNEKERLQVDGFDSVYTNDDLKLVEDGNPIPTYESSDYGNYEDNDFSPDSPKPTQLSHALTYLFLNKATFNAVFSIEEHRDFKTGRNVLFSGISQLVFCQDPSTYLDFSASSLTTNNLGGHGPGAGAHELRYSAIARTDAGQSLDLVATADETYGYKPWNTSQNGLHGDFGHINLFCGPNKAASEAYVTFTVVRSGTNEPVVLNQFAFVVFDFDTGLHEQQVEYVEMAPNAIGFEGGSGYASYIVTDTTELAISSAASGAVEFKATKHGTEADNPTTAQNLAREVADKSVVFTFRKTSSFTITLGITATGYNTGRNFMFSGQDMYLMCD